MRIMDPILARSCSPMEGLRISGHRVIQPYHSQISGTFAIQFGPNSAIWASVVKKRNGGRSGEKFVNLLPGTGEFSLFSLNQQ